MGLCNTTFIVSVQNSVGPEIRGIATESTLFTRMLGSAIGATLNLNLQYRLPRVSDPVQQLMEKATRGAMEAGQLSAMTESVAASVCGIGGAFGTGGRRRFTDPFRRPPAPATSAGKLSRLPLL